MPLNWFKNLFSNSLPKDEEYKEPMITRIKNAIYCLAVEKTDIFKSIVYREDETGDSFDVMGVDGYQYNIKISKVYTDRDRDEAIEVFCGKK